MGLTILDKTEAEDECRSQKEIFGHISSCDDFVFNAGAGAGKTYSLKESIKYTLLNFSNLLEKRKQKILCITYTNLAASEIKNRVGNSDLVSVSTIHEGMWGIINNQQSALKKIHEIKIIEEIEKLSEDFKPNAAHYDWFYSQPNEKLRKKFYEKLVEKDTVDLFYKSQKRKTLVEDFTELLAEYGYIMKRNKGKFESLFKYATKLKKLENGLTDVRKERGIRIKYNIRSNFDRLDKMEISHDTLLEYVYKLCSSYPKMIDIFIDKFPFIFVDEYQDTHPFVIKTLSLISTRAKERDRPLCIGYFGDTLQSIYQDGVGSKIDSIHSGLNKVEKKQNRRSYAEIIDVFDRFRNDGLSQKSIYEDSNGGMFKYYSSKIEGDESQHIDNLVSKIKKDFGLTGTANVSCLVLKNDTISDICGFPQFYRKMKSAFFYSDAPRLIINKDLSKLNEAVKEIYNLIEFVCIINRDGLHLSDILPNNIGRISFSEVNKYYDELKSLNADPELSLRENLSSILGKEGGYGRLFIGYLSEVISCVDSDYTVDGIIGGISDLLEKSSSKDAESAANIINDLFDINLKEFKNWFTYLKSNVENEDIYLTCHNSKGLEFETVIVFLSDSFNNKTDYLSAFFDDTENDEYTERRNLLYVSLSRAIKNMAVVFTHEEIEPSTNVNKYFGAAQHI
ncbi:UvrD-helicase domain-containing protein [Vibrio vulnificus]|uniref:UvrD-helicase domain-containing protein n=1 Tax=Vibrio vulnificus TaxID=672 RepID=UPI003ED8E784